MKTDLIKYFTYFLAVQKCRKDSNYTIHGLWVDYQRGGYPQFCKPSSFNKIDLLPLQPDLNQVWPSCNGDNSRLWEHEWKKHGTCIEKSANMSLIEYFQKTLDLYYQNIENIQKHCIKRDCLIPIEYYQIKSPR